jgi:hypothetical protein
MRSPGQTSLHDKNKIPCVPAHIQPRKTFSETDQRGRQLQNMYGLFNDAVNSSDCIPSTGRMIRERLMGRDLEGSGGRIFESPCNRLEGLRKSMKDLSRDNRVPTEI